MLYPELKSWNKSINNNKELKNVELFDGCLETKKEIIRLFIPLNKFLYFGVAHYSTLGLIRYCQTNPSLLEKIKTENGCHPIQKSNKNSIKHIANCNPTELLESLNVIDISGKIYLIVFVLAKIFL